MDRAKQVKKKLNDAVNVLSGENLGEKLEYLAGFAEGVAAMARRQEEKEE
nr:MAG TPA: hypothetical protein [Caudoviricetes sp.]